MLAVHPGAAMRSSGSRPGGTRGKGHVHVCVRVRPLMMHEAERGDAVSLRVGMDSRSLHVMLSKVGDRETLRQYEFDHVCGPSASQREFFEMSGVKNLIDNALEGVNVSVFAYGQTGSGKTFSMSGHEERIVARTFAASDETAGVIPRAVEYLYARLLTAPRDTRTIVRASYCEIYNEMIYDLLNLTGESLPLRWNSSLGFFVQGQLVVQCDSMEDVMAVITEGHRNRTVGTHALNVDSSRSHSLLTLMIERTSVDPMTGDTLTRRSKVIFVDLAGSERLKESKSEGLTALETRQINKSLFVLGKVIAALSEKKGGTAPSGSAPHRRTGMRSHSPPKRERSVVAQGDGGEGPGDAHIPYRDSKLTKLLMDSLGGNALTLMVACVSPASAFLEETINTLQYAMRASKIENAPIVQVDTKDAMIAALRRETRALRYEVEVWRSFLGLPPDMPFEDALAHLQHNRAPAQAPTHGPSPVTSRHPTGHPQVPPSPHRSGAMSHKFPEVGKATHEPSPVANGGKSRHHYPSPAVASHSGEPSTVGVTADEAAERALVAEIERLSHDSQRSLASLQRNNNVSERLPAGEAWTPTPSVHSTGRSSRYALSPTLDAAAPGTLSPVNDTVLIKDASIKPAGGLSKDFRSTRVTRGSKKAPLASLSEQHLSPAAFAAAAITMSPHTKM